MNSRGGRHIVPGKHDRKPLCTSISVRKGFAMFRSREPQEPGHPDWRSSPTSQLFRTARGARPGPRAVEPGRRKLKRAVDVQWRVAAPAQCGTTTRHAGGRPAGHVVLRPRTSDVVRGRTSGTAFGRQSSGESFSMKPAGNAEPKALGASAGAADRASRLAGLEEDVAAADLRNGHHPVCFGFSAM
jgi:hypothetical protein